MCHISSIKLIVFPVHIVVADSNNPTELSIDVMPTGDLFSINNATVIIFYLAFTTC